jgi:predicted DNA binding CopG/RHH family protein
VSEGVKKMKQKSRIPEFTSREEEAKFWETHPISDYMDEFEIVEARFAKNLSHGLTIRLDPETLHKVRSLARKKGIGATTLIRMWILEDLEKLEQQQAAQV